MFAVKNSDAGGPVARLVGIECGIVSGVLNLVQRRVRDARVLSRSRQFDGCEIQIIDGLPDWSSRTSVETAGTGTGNPRRSPW